MASGEQTGELGLDKLVTEGRLTQDADYANRSTRELLEVGSREDAIVPAAVAAAADELAAAIDTIVEKLRDGGRLVYVGAGTSGRLAALDAEECESTFSTEPGQVTAIVAGASLGPAAERDAAEDDSVDAALAAAGGDAKVAIVSLLGDVDAEAARARLERAGGSIRRALR